MYSANNEPLSYLVYNINEMHNRFPIAVASDIKKLKADVGKVIIPPLELYRVHLPYIMKRHHDSSAAAFDNRSRG